VKFSIYTHGDFDGLVSGAIGYNFCKEAGLSLDKITFVEYSTYPPEVWDSYRFDPIVNVVTDFPYSRTLPSSAFFIWADHHQERFAPDPSEITQGVCFYDPNAPSCARVLEPLARLNPLLEALVPWADMVDSARYESAEQAVLMKDPPLRVAVAMTQTFNDDVFRVELLKMICQFPPDQILSHPKVDDAYRRYTWKQERSIDFLQKNLVLHEDKGVLVGICSFVGYKFSSRYAAFLVQPDLDFLIHIRSIPPWDSPTVSLSISYNPWKEFTSVIPLHEVLCDVYDGDSGGHVRVAAAVLPNAQAAMELARKLAQVVCVRLAAVREKVT